MHCELNSGVYLVVNTPPHRQCASVSRGGCWLVGMTSPAQLPQSEGRFPGVAGCWRRRERDADELQLSSSSSSM